MKRFINSYPMVLLGEAIGAKEILSKKYRYSHLSRSFKIFSLNKSDDGIWEFYQARKECYKNIGVFTAFILTFLILMSFVLSKSFIVAVSTFFVSLLVYGLIGVFTKAERNYKYLWDDKPLFMEFLKFNRTQSFNPVNFDNYVELSRNEVVHQEPTFEEELRILKSETNRFNSVDMKTMIDFFDIIRENAGYPTGLKCVQISDKDFLRFIKSKFSENSEKELDIMLIKGDKNHVKALFYNFYTYSTKFEGETKKNRANMFKLLYLTSFSVFDKRNYNNFTDSLALDYSKHIQRFFKMH